MTARELFADALFLGGAAAVTFGAWLVFEPAGFVVGGLLSCGAGWALGRL